VAGKVAIVGRDTREVVVHAEISGSSDFLEKFDVTAEQDSSGVTVRGSVRGWLERLFSRPVVHFIVSVPHDYSVKVNTAGGGIEVRDVTGSINLLTSGGNIYGERLKGPTELRTAGGNIDVMDCTASLEVHTSGGNIRLDNITGPVTALTNGGSIYAEVLANHGVSLTTSAGSITLQLPSDARASIDASTSGTGRVGLELPLSSIDAETSTYIRGAINGGGERVLLHTAGGSVHLQPTRSSKALPAAASSY
jgi:DUF4097 and DUF4098 domain-containing protein YvlB